ncbi:MAG: RidA family protein [Bacteroidota bacterium]
MRSTGFLLLLPMLFFILSCQPTTPSNDDQKEELSPEQILDSLGIRLPQASPPVANYVNATMVPTGSGYIVFLAGKGPKKADGTYILGKLGEDLSIEEGYEAARIAGINQLAALKAEIGELSRVKRILKVRGMVNATPEFGDQPKVVNGFSDLMVAVFGENGKHARAAVGMGSLPFNMAVEIEMVVAIE